MKKIWKGFIAAWKWVFSQLKDRKNRVIFYIVFTIMGSPVWVGYTLGIIFKGQAIGTTGISIASAYLFFFNCVPCTPFLPICVGITTGVRAILNKTIWKGEHKDACK